MRRMGGKRLQALGLIGAAFFAGGWMGYAARGLIGDGGSVPAQLPSGLDSLALSSAQRERVSQIIARARPRVHSIVQDMLPELRALENSLRAQIRGELNENQVRLLELHPEWLRIGVRARRPSGGIP